ncbi:MAG: hypothetical protein LBU05_05705 [Bifidobacteriaceae bacterium]|nr:hypothetical protein [Bifidobacteriaceae bacterium]
MFAERRPASAKRPLLALVESPAQLLHVLEYAAAHPAERLRAAVLAPTRTADSDQLMALAELARDAGLPVDWFEPRRSAAQTAATALQLARQTGRQLIVGDLFSGLIQSILILGRPAGVIAVDDGAATIESARRLVEGRPLMRGRSRPAAWRRLAGTGLASAARRTLADTKAVEFFTVMPIAGIISRRPGARATRHHYAWIKAAEPSPAVRPGLDVVGSSLVAAGTVTAESYLTAVAALVARHSTAPEDGQAARQDTRQDTGQAAGQDAARETRQGAVRDSAVRDIRQGAGQGAGQGAERANPVRYFAHRRENPATLEALAKLGGIDIIRPALPLELALRQAGVSHRIVTLPTSTAFTLPVALADLPVNVELLRPDGQWIDPTASHDAVARLARLDRLASRHLPAADHGQPIPEGPYAVD